MQAVGVQGVRPGKHFDRHIAAQPRIAGPVDLSHATGTNRADDFVRSEVDARGEWHARERGIIWESPARRRYPLPQTM